MHMHGMGVPNGKERPAREGWPRACACAACALNTLARLACRYVALTGDKMIDLTWCGLLDHLHRGGCGPALDPGKVCAPTAEVNQLPCCAAHVHVLTRATTLATGVYCVSPLRPRGRRTHDAPRAWAVRAL